MKSILFLFVAVAIVFFPDHSFALSQEESGIEYSVQILSSKKHLEDADKKFKGVKDIHEEIMDNIHKYTTGRVKNFSEATELMAKMQGLGFKDAFVVRYKDGKRAPVEKNATAENQTATVKEEAAKPAPVKNEAKAEKQKPAVEKGAAMAAPVKEEKTATTKTGKKDKPVVGFSMSRREPEFNGGHDSLTIFIVKNLKLPAQRITKPEEGQVMVSFTIDTIGKVKNAKVIGTRGKELDAEALRVIHMMPDWTPGTINGTPTDMEVLLSVDFYRPH